MNKHMSLREKAVGYARVSTNLQVERNDSLKRQAEHIQQAARDNGWALLGIYEDVASAVATDTRVRGAPWPTSVAKIACVSWVTVVAG